MSLLAYFLLFIAQYDVTWLCVCVCVCVVCVCVCVSVRVCRGLLRFLVGVVCAFCKPGSTLYKKPEARSPLLISQAVHKYQMALTVVAV